MTKKRTYPYGRVRQDTVAQPISKKPMALLCAQILQRITGEDCDVIPRGRSVNILVRCAGDRWIRA
jgi:hypothetical protein